MDTLSEVTFFLLWWWQELNCVLMWPSIGVARVPEQRNQGFGKATFPVPTRGFLWSVVSTPNGVWPQSTNLG